MRGRSNTGPVGRPVELAVMEPEPRPEKLVPGSRTGTDGEVVPEPLLDEPPLGNDEDDDELPEFTLDELEPPAPKIPAKRGPS